MIADKRVSNPSSTDPQVSVRNVSSIGLSRDSMIPKALNGKFGSLSANSTFSAQRARGLPLTVSRRISNDRPFCSHASPFLNVVCTSDLASSRESGSTGTGMVLYSVDGRASLSGLYEVPAIVGITKAPLREHVMAVATSTLVNARDSGSVVLIELSGDGTSNFAAY